MSGACRLSSKTGTESATKIKTWPAYRGRPDLIQIMQSNRNQGHVDTHGTGNRERFTPRDVTKASRGAMGKTKIRRARMGGIKSPPTRTLHRTHCGQKIIATLGLSKVRKIADREQPGSQSASCLAKINIRTVKTSRSSRGDVTKYSI